MSKQIELHLHYPLVAHTWDLNAFCTTNAKRNLSIFSQTPVLCLGSRLCGLYRFMPDQKDILPRAPAAGWGARTFSLQTSTNTHRSKKRSEL